MTPSSQIIRFALLCLPLLAVGNEPATASNAVFEESVVWRNGEDGMLTYHVPTVFVSHRGTILAAADARFGNYGDFDPHHIVLKRSTDNGKTWGSNDYIARSDGKQIFLFPNFIQPRGSERIYFFYTEKAAEDIHGATHVWLRYSDDDGLTWSAPRDLAPVLVAADSSLKDRIADGSAGEPFIQTRYSGARFLRENPALYGRRSFYSGPGVAIQLSANHKQAPGRLVVPLLAMQRRDAPHIQRGQGNCTLISDDNGETWRAGGTVPIGRYTNSEPSVVELASGDLLINARVEGSTDRVVALSKDGGLSWTQSEVDSTIPKFFETHAGLLRLVDPASARSRLLFSFPDCQNAREKMTVLLSYDDHRTWPVRRVVHYGASFYSNMAQAKDGTMLLIYGRGSTPNRWMPAETVAARFNLEWLTEGRDQLGSRTTH